MIAHPRRSRRAVAVAAAPIHDHDADYAALLASVHAAFATTAGAPLFRTNVDFLFDIYLNNLPAEQQVHTCSCCRRFVNDFGGIVRLTADGRQHPAMWCEEVPDFYMPAMAAMRKAVTKARVISPMLSAEKVWGTPQTGTWSHFAVPAPKPFKHALLTPGQAAAAKREDFGTVARALVDFTPEMLAEALRLLESDALSRSERFLSPVRWLLDLHTARNGTKDTRLRDNMLWLAIATAPDGYCHPRAGVIGSLLEDIAAGMVFSAVKARWEAKTHPLHYQRPQAAPSAGNLAEAERIVEKLGIARSLERRFARLDECETIWRPAAAKGEPAGIGVFGHLKPKDAPSAMRVELPTQTMTWEKFARVVLPEAEAVEFLAPTHGNYTAMLAAAHLDAPPIIKWDREDARNTVTSYVYHSGTPAARWRVTSGWMKVTAITLRSNMWGADPAPHLGEGLTLILDGAVDLNTGQGNALFPETLKPELHAIRATIEAYSKNAEIGGREEASACGYGWGKGRIDGTLRVTAAGRQSLYKIDRWD